MKFACRAGAALFFVLVAACKAEKAPPSVLEEFSFDRPCAELPSYFSERDVVSRGDPSGIDTHVSVLLDHPYFRVIEIRCARIKGPDGEVEPRPVELTFFSGGEDEAGRLTQGARKLEELLTKSIGAEPWKKLQTGRWETREWTGSPQIVREYKSGPHDSRSVKVLFARYPTNTPGELDTRLRTFLKLLAEEPLSPPAEE